MAKVAERLAGDGRLSTGQFITFEGGEGCGKSTQARLLVEALEAGGRQAILTREPGGTEGAEAIRKLLLDPSGPGWNQQSEALLFAAARADHVASLIAPSVAAGKWVVCDRFLDSTRAYQGGEGGLPDADILELHRVGSGGFMPALTLLIEVTPEVAEQRVSLRDGEERDRIGGRDAAFHAKVAARFGEIADAEPNRVVRIDGNGSAEEVHAGVLKALDSRLGVEL